MKALNCFAAIITYNPDQDWLMRNISSIAPQVDYLLLIDNHSRNINEVESAVNDVVSGGKHHIEIVKNPDNMGIAYALNQIMTIGQDRGYQWVLTLDQDSICQGNIIEELTRFSMNYEEIPVGIFAARNVDINVKLEEQSTANAEAEEPFVAITSGSMTNIQAVLECGGFADELFIDYVDFDISIRLRQKGYKIINVKSAVIQHELGSHRYRQIGNREFSSANHSYIRKYYIYRNYIYMYRKFFKIEPAWLRLEGKALLKNFVTLFLVEDRRIRKYLFILKGLLDGLLGRFGKL